MQSARPLHTPAAHRTPTRWCEPEERGMEATISIGSWIKQRWKALDLTQEALARRIGCATVTLQKIELEERRPSREIAERLADAFELAPEERAPFLRSAR